MGMPVRGQKTAVFSMAALLNRRIRSLMDALQRRYDRHKGKHDCLYGPQYFLNTMLHWAFVWCISAVPSMDLAYPAYQS
jgi:hypothetical protein